MVPAEFQPSLAGLLNQNSTGNHLNHYGLLIQALGDEHSSANHKLCHIQPDRGAGTQCSDSFSIHLPPHSSLLLFFLWALTADLLKAQFYNLILRKGSSCQCSWTLSMPGWTKVVFFLCVSCKLVLYIPLSKQFPSFLFLHHHLLFSSFFIIFFNTASPSVRGVHLIIKKAFFGCNLFPVQFLCWINPLNVLSFLIYWLQVFGV